MYIVPLNRTCTIFFLVILFFANSRAQVTGSKDQGRRYTQAQLLDSIDGVLIYQKMMKVLVIDHEILKKEGYEVQGWNEEYFDNGELQHISYYKEDRLVLFKNYFSNGQCEHNISFTDPVNCNIDVYFETGNLRNQINYYKNAPKKLTEFFANGLPKSTLEYDPENHCLLSKKSWYLNAETQSDLMMIDPKLKKYNEKVFYPNGQLKEEGELIFSDAGKEYIKTGTWYTYENGGKKKHAEKFNAKLSSR